MQPIYDINASWQENVARSLVISAEVPNRVPHRFNFLGYDIASRIGAAACPVTTSNGIIALAKLGYDVLTYKTIRAQAAPVHPLPNIVYCKARSFLQSTDAYQRIEMSQTPTESMETLVIANSFGNACPDAELVHKDIARARAALLPGQVLQVSVYGDGRDESELANSFQKAALLAKDGGAHVIELNLSCPNIHGGHGLLYHNVTCAARIVAAVVSAVGNLPVTAKVGYFEHRKTLVQCMIASARAGARGICGINTLPMHVVNQDGEPVFGASRAIAGISGAPLRDLALEFVRHAVQSNREHQLGLTIIGVGGVTKPEHFDGLLEAGADVVLSATGMMWDPLLASKYHEQYRMGYERKAASNYQTVV